MATTTNYGWTTPDDTALVKDGASAIRTLGSSIDTTLKTQIDAQIPDSLLTTKGDLIAATGASTPARLAVGTNGQALLANSATATGLEWGTPASGGATLLSTTSLTGVSTTISGISGSYKNIYGIVSGVTNATANGILQLAINGSSSLQTFWKFQGSSVTNWRSTNNDWQQGYFNSGAAAYITWDRTSANNVLYFEIKNYASTSTYKPINSFGYYFGEGDYNPIGTGGAYTANTAVTSINFKSTGGNLSTGTVLLYGVN